MPVLHPNTLNQQSYWTGRDGLPRNIADLPAPYAHNIVEYLKRNVIDLHATTIAYQTNLAFISNAEGDKRAARQAARTARKVQVANPDKWLARTPLMCSLIKQAR